METPNGNPTLMDHPSTPITAVASFAVPASLEVYLRISIAIFGDVPE